MRSLFLKIFLWFWTVQILLGIVMFAVVSVTRSEPGNPRWRAFISDTLMSRAETAASIYGQYGRAGLEDYWSHDRGRRNIPVSAYGANGALLAGRAMDDGPALTLKAVGSQDAEWLVLGDRILAARHTTLPGGQPFVLVAQLRNAPPSSDFWRDVTRPFRGDPRYFFVFFAMSGIVCYGLARYLTTPAIKLRTATRRLASGDLSARVGAQMGRRRDELADLGHDFDKMAERMQSLMLAERRLLGDISHELRSPLARLNVALDLAAQDADEQTNSYLERIGRESERLNEMIGQLLALTRLESGEAHAQRAEVDLAKLVNEVAADADFEARSRNRQVEVETEKCSINGNVSLLRSAVENVVRNAVRYTAEGTSAAISLKCEKRGDSNQSVIRVRDHGPGVPTETLDKIFRPFYRVADARDRQSGGTGLGLAIAERAVRYHGGEVTASNAADGGLLVEIRLPHSAN